MTSRLIAAATWSSFLESIVRPIVKLPPDRTISGPTAKSNAKISGQVPAGIRSDRMITRFYKGRKTDPASENSPQIPTRYNRDPRRIFYAKLITPKMLAIFKEIKLLNSLIQTGSTRMVVRLQMLS